MTNLQIRCSPPALDALLSASPISRTGAKPLGLAFSGVKDTVYFLRWEGWEDRRG